MPIRSPLPAAIAALLCISLPAGGQDHPPDRARKTGTVAPTSVGVSFKEWTVPTPRSFPHDPLAAADGAIWYTGQMASTLGRLDPKTGAFKEYRTKTPDSGPHGLAADKDGNIWFTASFHNRPYTLLEFADEAIVHAAEMRFLRLAEIHIGKESPDADRKFANHRLLDLAEPADELCG